MDRVCRPSRTAGADTGVTARIVYGALANLVLLVHFVFVVFAVAGALLVFRWKWVAWLHVPAAAWAALIEFAGWVCPLTPLEVELRMKGGAAGYSGGFIDHYLLAILYPRGLTREVQFALGTFVVVLNVSLYAWLLWRRSSRRKQVGSS